MPTPSKFVTRISLINIIIALIIAFTLAPVPGCTTHQKNPTTKNATATHQTLTPGTVFIAKKLWPLSPSQRRYSLDRKDAPKNTSDQPPHDTPSQGHFTITDDGTNFKLDIENLRQATLALDTHNNLTTISETHFAQNVIVRYDPPLPILPANLTAGQTFSESVNMTVHDLASNNVRERGTCTTHIQALTVSDPTNPNGLETTVTVRQTRKISLKTASASITIDTTYKPNLGPIRESVNEKTKPLRLFTIRRYQAIYVQ